MGQEVSNMVSTMVEPQHNVEELDYETIAVVSKVSDCPPATPNSIEPRLCLLEFLDKSYARCLANSDPTIEKAHKKVQCYEREAARYYAFFDKYEANLPAIKKEIRDKYILQAKQSQNEMKKSDSDQVASDKVENALTQKCGGYLKKGETFNLLEVASFTGKYSMCAASELCPTQMINCLNKADNAYDCMSEETVAKCAGQWTPDSV